MQTHPYSCLTCSLAFTSSTAQRGHYSSDLHRYNAKRRVAELPPVSAEVFNDKIVERREKLAGIAGGKGGASKDGSGRLDCKACGKTFSSQNAQDDHLKSRKHRERVLRGVSNIQVDQPKEAATQAEATPSELAEPVVNGDNDDEKMEQSASTSTEAAASTSSTVVPKYESTSCLFCPRSFSSLEVNLKHMSHNHAFYIPDSAFCVDIPGLLQQLGEDITLGNICLFCGHGFGGLVTGNETDAELVKRARRGTEAVRKHMVDKIHCRIPWDSEDQRLMYSDYYDYSSSYPDHQGGVNSDGEMEVDENDTAEWEDEDGEDIDEGDDVVMDYSAVKDRRKIRKAAEEDLDMRLQTGGADFELVLPNGNRIGHRALKGIYKQNMMPYIDLDAPKDKLSRLLANEEARAARKEHNSWALVRRGGNNGDLVIAKSKGEAKNARDVEKGYKAQKQMQRRMLQIGIKGNNQEHYRDMLLQ